MIEREKTSNRTLKDQVYQSIRWKNYGVYNNIMKFLKAIQVSYILNNQKRGICFYCLKGLVLIDIDC